jgi:hypothetical protein
MLDRPTTPDRRTTATARATARQRRNRRYAERRRRGRIVISIEIDESVIDLLIRTEWLNERDADDRGALERALQRMLQNATAQQ